MNRVLIVDAWKASEKLEMVLCVVEFRSESALLLILESRLSLTTQRLHLRNSNADNMMKHPSCIIVNKLR